MNSVTDVQEMTTIDVQALVLRWPNGRERQGVYTLWAAGLPGGVNHIEVNRCTFNNIMDAAGEPTWTEDDYWGYDDVPIQWGDVFAEDEGQS